jgi:hypothetical protein
MFEFPTSNPFNAAPPMSDENETDNPYQPPGPSDKPLSRKDADGPKTRLNPVHRLVPIFGYAYVPAIFIFQDQFLGYSIEEMLDVSVRPADFVYFFIPFPVYVIVILFLDWRRNSKGRNTIGMILYHGLSLTLPALYFNVKILFAFLGLLAMILFPPIT